MRERVKQGKGMIYGEEHDWDERDVLVDKELRTYLRDVYVRNFEVAEEKRIDQKQTPNGQVKASCFGLISPRMIKGREGNLQKMTKRPLSQLMLWNSSSEKIEKNFTKKKTSLFFWISSSNESKMFPPMI